MLDLSIAHADADLAHVEDGESPSRARKNGPEAPSGMPPYGSSTAPAVHPVLFLAFPR